MKKITNKLITGFIFLFFGFFVNIYPQTPKIENNIKNNIEILDTLYNNDKTIVMYQMIDTVLYKVKFFKDSNKESRKKMSLKFAKTYPYKKKLDPIIEQFKDLELTKENIIKVAVYLEIEKIDVFFYQVIIESGNLKSKVCTNNNNIKGMRLAKQRFTYGIGSKSKYAVYKTWIHSIADYKIWQLQNPWLKNKETYGEYLDRRGYGASSSYGRRMEKYSNKIFKKYQQFYNIEKQKYDFFKKIKLIFIDKLII